MVGVLIATPNRNFARYAKSFSILQNEATRYVAIDVGLENTD